MAEKHYAFLVTNCVVSVLVFAEQDDDLATRICIEQNYDKFIWLNEELVGIGSIYNKASNNFAYPVLEKALDEPVK
jgi:hypothetical protein